MNEPRFLITELMPCAATEMRVPRYMLPSLFGNAEMEEAAARVLTLVCEKGEWSGITWREIAMQMKAEYEAHNEDDKALEAYYEQLRAYESACRGYTFGCIVTLSLYRFFVAKPVAPQKPERRDSPFSLIFLAGPKHVITGLKRLIDGGLLRKETVGEGEETNDVFYPTVKLVNAVITGQRPN